jgi:hypothetical protein
MAINTTTYQGPLSNERAAKPALENLRTTTQQIRALKKDLAYLKDEGVKEIRITKIDRNKRIIHLWVYKPGKQNAIKIINIICSYPYRYSIFSDTSYKKLWLLKCVLDTELKEKPRGIVVLN